MKRTEDGRRETEDGRRETEDGRRETEDGRRKAKTLNSEPGTLNWQGRCREQVEFAATLLVASMAGIFLMAIVIAIIKIVN
jgi:hypothetical protein